MTGTAVLLGTQFDDLEFHGATPGSLDGCIGYCGSAASDQSRAVDRPARKTGNGSRNNIGSPYEVEAGMVGIDTLRLPVTSVVVEDHAFLRDYYLANADHLRATAPIRPAGYHGAMDWRKRTRQMVGQQAARSALHLLARYPDGAEIVGVCSFTNMVRGVFQACNLGYSIDAGAEGKGLMSEIPIAALAHIFDELDFHRVMANHLPENERSARLLSRLGFGTEGNAKSYLMIAGRWRDHVLTSKLNTSHSAQSGQSAA